MHENLKEAIWNEKNNCSTDRSDVAKRFCLCKSALWFPWVMTSPEGAALLRHDRQYEELNPVSVNLISPPYEQSDQRRL